jgi:hypothetical protein
MRHYPARPCGDCGKTFVPLWPSTIRCDDCHASHKPAFRSCCDCKAILTGIRRDPRRCNKCHEVRSRPAVLVCRECGETFERPGGSRATACNKCRTQASKKRRRDENRQWRSRNQEKQAAQKSRWKERKRDHVRAYKREYERRTRREDYRAKLVSLVRSRVAAALKMVKYSGKIPASRGAWRLVGCTLADLVVHLESQFEQGMSWANFGRSGWHVDHIYPVSRADLTDKAQLLAAFNWQNCRPAWEADNLKKSAKVTATTKRHFDELVAFFREEASPPTA